METQPRQREQRPREEWFDGTFVENWLAGQHDRESERMAHFTILRSAIPHTNDESFRYLNMGAGDGWLDEVILSRYSRAEATLLDGSTVMLERAQERLRPFSDRVGTAQGDFGSPAWRDELRPPYDVVVSSIAIHNLFDIGAIRALYAEVFEVVADGGLFLNFDYIRPVTPLMGQLTRWAGSDSEARYTRERAGGTGSGSRGSLEEQLIWLRDAGFSPVECLWKEFQTVLLAGFKGAVRIPASR